MSFSRSAPVVGVLLLLSTVAVRTFGESRVDNFVLLDQHGRAQELYYQSDATAVVIVAQSNACAVQDGAPSGLGGLAGSHPDVRFWLINATDNRAAMLQESTGRAVDLPILEDAAQIITPSLGLTHAGQALVIDTKTWRVLWRGTQSGLAPVLTALSDGAALPSAELPSGLDETENACSIAADHGDDGRSISYSDTIAPMLSEHCAYCHVEGGIAPWAMTGYDMVRGFAPMIREVVRTRRMPPWHADPHIGTWQGDRSLDPEATRTLVRWIEAGAPRGDGPDPLAGLAPLATEWPLGPPDIVVDIPGFEVPASGSVDYRFPYVKNTLDHGVWIRAATVLPGDRRVVHHVLAGSVEGEQPPGNEDSVMDNYIIGYAPGAESYVMPDGTGVYLPPGGHFTFQMHYTPIGMPVVDHSRMGLYLAAEPPPNFLRHTVVISPRLDIPPNAAAHEESAYYEFHDDVVIHTLFPHAHYRGRASTFEVRYPDGRLETVLSVPDYDFNWQRGYDPVEPPVLPAGSRLIHRTVYDNSAKNPANPDPTQTVRWGLQSWEEMLYGAVSYSYVRETTQHPIHDVRRSRTTQFVGFLDRNMDGKVSWREMPRDMQKRLVQGFKAVDTNADGGLDIDEFMALSEWRETRQTEEPPAPAHTGD
ncbi:MAG: hypothetical protein AB7I04_03350 [Pseudomonadales bacterium]